MTDDGTTPNRRPDLAAIGQPDPPLSHEDWRRLPRDPDIEAHLGYEQTDWELIETTDGSDMRILLPADSEMVHDDAFIVADDDAIIDLTVRR